MSKRVQRRKERELALWGIFRLDYGDSEGPISEILEHLPDEETVKDLNTTSGSYANEVVEAYTNNAEEVDELISNYLKEGWTFNKLAKAEKAILRLGITEMLMTEDPVPKEIAINEAVELAKKYGEDGATGYINGILNKVADEKNL